MKCPKCGINLLEHIEVCPFCKTAVPKEEVVQDEVKKNTPVTTNTGRYATVDPAKDSYDFDLQYTLTFKDSGEIKQAIANIDASNAEEYANKKKESARKESEGPRFTLEEMQAAALRAQQRREKRNALKNGDGTEPKKRITTTERKKMSAMRSAKQKQMPKSDKRVNSPKRLIFGAGVLALVVVLIIGIVNICSYFAHKDPILPTVYTVGNELYSSYDGKTELLTSNFITKELENVIPDSEDEDEDEDREDSSSVDDESSDETEAVDPKLITNDEFTKKELINVSENGDVIFFFENVDMEAKTGNLVYYESGKKKSKTVLGQNVYYDIVIGNDGASVLYLNNTGEDGKDGELYYWTPEKKEPVAVEKGISAGNFKLSQDSLSATYIKNFNEETYTGDLFYISFEEDAAPAKRVDEKVSFVFGTSPKSKTYFYAKNYDTEVGTYDLYVQSDAEGPKMIAEKGLLAPVIPEKTELVYVYSNYKDNFQTLSCIDLDAGTTTLLSEEVTEIIRVRNDEGAVIYSKAYESEKADYYFVNAKSPNPQTVATAINVSDDIAGDTVMFDASDDFSKIAYIGAFDAETKRGALFTLSIINDYPGSEMRISDDAYSCDVSVDGTVVRFAAGYNKENDTVNLVSYLNSTTLALSDGVAVGAYTFDKLGEYTVYAKNVNKETHIGTVESVNQKGKIKQFGECVRYGFKNDGTILLLTMETEGDNQKQTLSTAKVKGGKAKVIAENIADVLSY